MQYQIYKTTNLLDGKFYIGKHACRCKKCSYMGSGKYLKDVIKKYGKDNFKKEVLFILNSEEEMNEKEKDLVTEDFVKRDDTYNLGIGGQGGLLLREGNFFGKKHTEKSKKQMSKSHLGSTHREETKKQISMNRKGKLKGEDHPHFGSIWITNGVSSRKIKEEDTIPNGWKKGRTLASTERTYNFQNVGRKWINDGKTSRFVHIIDNQIPDGWSLGMKSRKL